jgi:NADH-quinone oxidoreductase subunit N
MLIALLSLGGIPPFAGFIGKILVFAAAVQADLIWLAILGVLNSIVALYYYLVIMKTIYSQPADREEAIPVTPAMKVALSFCVAGIILLGSLLFNFGLKLTDLASIAFRIY